MRERPSIEISQRPINRALSSKHTTLQRPLLTRISLTIALIALLCLSSHLALLGTDAHARPLNRVDLAGNYMFADIGDGQRATLVYTRTLDERLSGGLGAQYQRREFGQLTVSDVMLSAPLYYQSAGSWSAHLQVDVTPSAEISPRYAFEVTPLWRLSNARGLGWLLSMRYRYARYSVAETHLAQPGLAYQASKWRLGVYAYLVVPTFGPNSVTPQLRAAYTFKPQWRVGWWSTYGYETLNERFFNPARQAPQWENLIRLTHLLSDRQGVDVNLSYMRFFPSTPEIAQELFNRDRAELTLHYFFKF